ncbi:NUDIX hydrolase [Streptomyces sp. NPDC014983]|uniref:NUDIX hydrolase n=1 Tax=Streptomyces sp. NPDC014983 TaxID=3364933 RepID=UPI0036F6749B
MPGPSSRPLAADHRGDLLVSFTFGTEDVLPGGAPTPMALTALWHRGAVVMVYDRFRRQWELPGGLLEPGESPRQAAVRELAEEGGQIPGEPLRFVGYAGFLLGPAQRAEHGALFTARAPRRRSVEATDEIAAVRWWEPTTTLPGRVSAIDTYLARLTLREGAP